MTLEAGTRVFMVALLSIKDDMNIEEVIRIFKDLPLEEDLPEEFWPKPELLKNRKYLELLLKNAKAF